MRKISFLIAAHNEEKIIAKTLENLLNLPYDDYEVIIGLDGCTDGTEEIVKKYVKKSKKIRYYSLDLRQGKPTVINEVIKKAKGEIIIINDADWIFKVKDKKSLKKFFSVFDDEEIGGICEAYPLEWNPEVNKNRSLGYKMTAYSSYFWYEFQKKRFAKRKGELLSVEDPALFMTNIFRRKLYKENVSLGDDFERTQNILGEGYKVVISENANNPKMIPTYNSISVRDLFRQKVRTSIARDQINRSRKDKIGVGNYYLPAVAYIFRNSWKRKTSVGLIIASWIILTSFATAYSKLKNIDTKKGWVMRAKR